MWSESSTISTVAPDRPKGDRRKRSVGAVTPQPRRRVLLRRSETRRSQPAAGEKNFFGVCSIRWEKQRKFNGKRRKLMKREGEIMKRCQHKFFNPCEKKMNFFSQHKFFNPCEHFFLHIFLLSFMNRVPWFNSSRGVCEGNNLLIIRLI